MVYSPFSPFLRSRINNLEEGGVAAPPPLSPRMIVELLVNVLHA